MTLLWQILLGCMGAILLCLVILYLTRPRYEDIRLSVAQFLDVNPSGPAPVLRISLANLVRSLPFYFQFAVLTILLITLIPLTMCQPTPEQTIGLWIFIDTSASMSTQQSEATRIELAIAEAAAGQTHLQQIASEEDILVCSQVTTFDLVARPYLDDLEALEHRAVGTELASLRNRLTQLPQTADCPLTHALIITDQGPPDFIYDDSITLDIIWRDVSQPVNHIGITEILAFRNPLTLTTEEIAFEITAYGEPPSLSAVNVLDQFDTEVEIDRPTVIWRQQQAVAQVSFKPTIGGEYTITIGDDSDPYIYDNTAVIAIPPPRLVQVDWQLENKTLFTLLEQQGWQAESETPHLRVVPLGTPLEDDIPTLIVGNQYLKNQDLARIGYFHERDNLIEDLNFDTAETLQIDGVLPNQVPANFEPVLGDRNQLIWFGQRQSPPAVFVPGLPTNPTGDVERYAFAATSFFNGVRWLLDVNESPPLYTLTTASQPDPEGIRIALHDGEGETDKDPVSVGEIEDIAPIVPPEIPAVENWPLFLALAFILFVIERLASVLGGRRWI